MQSAVVLVSLLLPFLQNGVLGFKMITPLSASQSHFQITEEAILETTLNVCRNVALTEGRDFSTLPGLLTTENVALACSSGSETFHSAKIDVKLENMAVDVFYFFNATYHFDNEEFVEGRKLITEGLSVVKFSVKRENFKKARQLLGKILHTLQDFYSHSNWIELGNTSPLSNLLRSDISIGKVADKSTATCKSCDGDDCQNNILENIIRDQILTSGYFGSKRSKPEGKCSHGGLLPPDMTSLVPPTGGINKDSLGAIHGHLHQRAAEVAKQATIELLEDIRGFAGDKNFLRLMGISTKSKALCFVIDTTGSMSDDISEVKRVTSLIVDRRRGTPAEPSLYILVPFNDPEFGPLTKTTDPDLFKSQINNLTAVGGGDFPEMSLSGLLLALTGAPPSSEIFLFTDATAKDAYLMGTVLALIERSKTVVHFLLTGSLGARRRRKRSSGGNENGQATRMILPEAQLYKDLAHASGGQSIQVTKSQLPNATNIILESSSSYMVTLLQVVRSPGKADNFSFLVDESVTNLTMYITGSSPSFTLLSPSGVSQSNLNTNGALASVQTVGNFATLHLIKQVGQWNVRMDSTLPYTLKVVGQSPINILFDLVDVSPGPDLAFTVLNTRPTSGGNASMVVTVTGSDSVTVTEVALVEASGRQEINGNVETLGGGNFLARMGSLPAGEFLVLLRGVDNSGKVRAAPVNFQRQSSIRIRTSSVIVQAASVSVFEPGASAIVSFTVSTNGTGGNFTIRATNDRGFNSSFPASLLVETGGSANGTVNLTAPADTPSGSDVTLTIEAEAPGAADTNYAVLRISVTRQPTDVVRPVCQVVSVVANCSANCSLSAWQFSASFSDGNGTGIQRVTVLRGDGTLNTSTALGSGGENVTLASYNASCCSPDVELVAVDGDGNVGTCFMSIRAPVDATNDTTFTSTPGVPVTDSTAFVTVTATTNGGPPLAQSFSLHLLAVILVFLILGG